MTPEFMMKFGKAVTKMNEELNCEKEFTWDEYFHTICVAISTKSPCLRRHIGALLVRDRSIVATGYNGPPRGFPHCKTCIREERRIPSGQGLDQCFAAHAERNCLINSARLGVSTIGATLYMNSLIPCKDCLIELANAGVKDLVLESVEYYHKESFPLVAACKFNLRQFEHLKGRGDCQE